MSGDGRGLLENAWGAGRILFALLTPFLGQRRLRWGAREDELQQVFPGDELVPEPRWQYLHGVTVRAPAALVWPWIAQLGQGRGGFYSYQLLENLVGCRIQNASAVLPQFQTISVGDPVAVHPKMPPLRVALVEPPHALVLHPRTELSSHQVPVEGEADPPNLTWAFIVRGEGRHSRLLSRYRAAYGPGAAQALAYGPWLVGPIGSVMDVKMLDGIRWRAEQAASPGPLRESRENVEEGQARADTSH